MIDKTFLQGLKGLHPYEVVVELGDYYNTNLGKIQYVPDRYVFTRDMLALMAYCCNKHKLPFGPPTFSGGKQEFVNVSSSFISAIVNEFRGLICKHDISTKGREYGAFLFGEGGLSDADIDEIQELLLRLRDAVAATDEITEEIKSKILENIYDIEKELHGISIDSRKLLGLIMPLWAMTKTAKDLFDITVLILQVATSGFEKQTGLPMKLMTQKLLE